MEIKIAETKEEKGELIPVFNELLKKTSLEQGFKTYSDDYYKKVSEIDGDLKIKIFSAVFNGEIIAVSFFAFFGDKGHYLYSASSKKSEYRRLNAPTFILWSSFLDAKKNGIKTMDLWDTRPGKGYSEFKKSFGGKEIEYIGAWDLVFNKPLYFLYKIAKLFLK